MIRVGIVGPPCSGKTKLARTLAARLREIDGLHRCELVEEFAREFLRGAPSTPAYQYYILGRQMERESKASNPEFTDVIITDAPILSSMVYTMLYSSENQKDSEIMSRIYREVLEGCRTNFNYDLVIRLSKPSSLFNDGFRVASTITPEIIDLIDNAIGLVLNSVVDRNRICTFSNDQEFGEIVSRSITLIKRIKNSSGH